VTDPLPGTIFLSPVHGPAGALIHLGQAIALRPCRYGHAGIVGPNRTAIQVGQVKADVYESTAIQAMPHGAERVPLGTLAPGTIFLDRMAAVLSDAQRERIVAAALSRVYPPRGPVGYGWWDYGSLILLHWHIRPRWVLRRVESTGTEICSQDADGSCQEAGIQIFDDHRDPGDVMPVSLWVWYDSMSDADLVEWAARQPA
jgi:hypothetical protein